MPIMFHALPTADVRALQNGQFDFYGQPAERAVSDGAGTPCRHCLSDTPKGAQMLIVAYRPFTDDQPYAEVGPIFLCGDHCEQFVASSATPPVLRSSPNYLIKGYGSDDRIVYGTGIIVAPDSMAAACENILTDNKVAYIHVRSARNNCYLCKVSRTTQ
ncbi:MAG: DUF1203 domain-containing protein [Rhodobacteraceae bacterium]|nr:DUF1203 domain-containing protein [Paracoccaceae bacterium]